MENAFNAFKSFVDWIDVLNPVQVVAISLVVIVVMEKYLGQIAQTDIERILSDQKNSFYERIALAIILFLFYCFCTSVFWAPTKDVGQKSFIILLLFYYIIAIAFYFVSEHCKKNENYNGGIVSMIVCMMLFAPAILMTIMLIVPLNEKLLFALCCLLCTINTFYITLIFEDARHSSSKNIILKNHDNTEKLYYYSNLGDSYIICGDAKDWKKASKITTVLIDEIIDGDYVLAYEEEKENNVNSTNPKSKNKGCEISNNADGVSTEIEESNDEQIAS